MEHNILILKKWIRLILFTSAFLQIIFFLNPENIYGTVVIVFGWLLIDRLILQPKRMKLFPISSFMLIGYGLFNFVFPLLLTLLEFHPVSFNLQIPYTTFSHLILYLLILLFTHFVYGKVTSGRNIIRIILRKTNFYYSPSSTFIWAATLIGILAMYKFWSSIYQTEISNKSFFQTMAGSIQPFAILPALLLFPHLINKNRYNPRNTLFIILTGLVVATIGITSNFRTAMFLELILIITLYFYSYLFGHIKIVASPKKVFIIIFGIYLFFGPLMDIATAMVYVRGTRTNVTSKELLKNTLEVASNKELINTIQNFAVSKSNISISEWDERYLNNAFLNRYCNLKINDACLYHASIIGKANPELQQALIDVLYSLVPRQLLTTFNVSLEQKTSAKLSLTDTLYYLSRNYSVTNGGAKIGSMQGIGMALFGYWYLLIIIPLFFIIFYMFDAYVDIRNGKILYSILILVGFVKVINYFNDRHVWSQELGFIIRHYWEGIILTCIFIFIVRIASKIINIKFI